jgi:hypothetical protein
MFVTVNIYAVPRERELRQKISAKTHPLRGARGFKRVRRLWRGWGLVGGTAVHAMRCALCRGDAWSLWAALKLCACVRCV